MGATWLGNRNHRQIVRLFDTLGRSKINTLRADHTIMGIAFVYRIHRWSQSFVKSQVIPIFDDDGHT